MEKNYRMVNNGLLITIDRKDDFINSIDPIITESCNLCCPHCWGFNSGHSLSIENFIRVLSFAKAMNIPNVQFTGGEPLLNNNIFVMSSISKNLGFYNRLRTNLSIKIFDELYIKKILEDFDTVYISIDGLARTNFKLRPSKEYISIKDKNENIFNNLADKMFNVIITNLKNLISIREKFKLNTNIVICSVIQKQNIHEIGDIIEFFNDYNIDCLDLTQIMIDKDSNCYISKEDFLENVYSNMEKSKNKIKIKPLSTTRCLQCEINGNIILANFNENTVIGNIEGYDIKVINNLLNKNIVKNYVNYFYIPFDKVI